MDTSRRHTPKAFHATPNATYATMQPTTVLENGLCHVRAQCVHGRKSEAVPVSVFVVQEITIIPSVQNKPPVIGAAMSWVLRMLSARVRILTGGNLFCI